MYTTHEDMIKLQMMAVTKMACPAMEMESMFLKKMEETTRYELKKVKENKPIKKNKPTKKQGKSNKNKPD